MDKKLTLAVMGAMLTCWPAYEFATGKVTGPYSFALSMIFTAVGLALLVVSFVTPRETKPVADKPKTNTKLFVAIAVLILLLVLLGVVVVMESLGY